MKVPDWLARRAADRADFLALLCGNVRWTFRELDARADAVAAALADLGVRRGDRVALLLRNGTAFVSLVHGISRLGGVLVPLNTRLAAPEISWQVANSHARLLVCDEHLKESVSDVRVQQVSASEVCCSSPMSSTPAPGKRCSDRTGKKCTPDRRIDLGQVHSILYTSGTTGRPKGAMLTYGNHWWSAIGSALNLGVHEDDRWLAVLPLFHVGGLSILLRGVIYGMPVVVHETFDPAAANGAIDEEGVTLVSVVSVMLRRMLDERGERPYPTSLRRVLLGGGPAPQGLLEECARRGLPVVQTYGLTETASQVATLSPEDALRKLGSAGRPLLPTEVRIDDAGAAVASGTPGEILVRGPTVIPGYADRPTETAGTIRDGWLHTGDLGYLDDEGYLYVLDRRDDLIISGGENVYPSEIEAVLLTHEAVEEAGVVGVPHPRWGHVPVAVVKPRAGSAPTEGELIAFCTSLLARYKVPARVHFADTLPRTAAGKLRRDLLHATVGGS